MEKQTLYSLTTTEIREYQRLLATNYAMEIVVTPFQRYAVFRVLKKDYAAICWPLGQEERVLYGIPDKGDVLLQADLQLQRIILPLLKKFKDIKVLVFPRYE